MSPAKNENILFGPSSVDRPYSGVTKETRCFDNFQVHRLENLSSSYDTRKLFSDAFIILNWMFNGGWLNANTFVHISSGLFNYTLHIINNEVAVKSSFTE